MTVADLPQAREYSQYDVSTRRFWAKSFVERDETFARMRGAGGLTWHPPLPSLFESNEPGFWAVTRRVDIAHVSTHPELFSSAQGVALDPMPVEVQRIATFFLAMDPPQHTVYRRLISSAFTPKNVKRIEDQIHANAVAVVDDLVGAGEVDFVAACSTRLPMMTISDMLGVAPSEREAVAHAAEKLFSGSDDEYATLEERATHTINEMIFLNNCGIELAKHRRAHPADDLMMALAAHPDQRDWLMADFDNRIGTAVEEFVRYASPVMQFARFVTADTELAGQELKAGDKVGLFYCSANRDEAVFDAPHGFDLSRSPNPHLGFGGGGPHFCLGSQVAKVELRNLFRELLSRLRRVEFGEPDYLLSNFVHGIKRVSAYVE